MKMAILSGLGKLAGLIDLPGSSVDPKLVQELLAKLAIVIALIVISGLLVGVLLVGALYAGYSALLYYDMPQASAMAITGLSAALITAILVVVAIQQARRLSEMPSRIMRRPSLLPSNDIGHGAIAVADAFIQGLLTRRVHTESK
ncbi:MAG: hypothetical protein WDO70_12180 [Alphaproteobacteria bacterium]